VTETLDVTPGQDAFSLDAVVGVGNEELPGSYLVEIVITYDGTQLDTVEQFAEVLSGG
jgi:hypothetical protein